MADDWQPGDLALCVVDGEWNPPEPCDPVAGGIYTVRAVSPHDFGLWFDGVDSCDSYEWFSFRRIPPLTDEERDEFLAEIKTPEPVH